MSDFHVNLQPGDTLEVTTNATPLVLESMQVLKGHGAPEDGVTGAGITDRGVWYLDLDTAFQYANVGTIDVPEWHGILEA